MSSSSFGFYETPMPSVSFCLFAHPIRLPLSIYISVPPRANKQKNRRFFLCVRMPRWNTAWFSADHRARPGNFYWRTWWNRWRWMALSNNQLFSKSWIFLTPSIIFVHGAKLSKIFKQDTYWIVFCEIRHTHISVLSNNPRFFKWWICISDFRDEFLSADIQ